MKRLSFRSPVSADCAAGSKSDRRLHRAADHLNRHLPVGVLRSALYRQHLLGMALPSTRILDRNGRLLYEVIDRRGGRHTAIPLDQIPQSCKDATIATEDRNFYSTQGIDLEGTSSAPCGSICKAARFARAAAHTAAGRPQSADRSAAACRAQSAPQTARDSWLCNWRTTRRDDILALYLNQTYYGNLAYRRCRAGLFQQECA
ncbi:MAG: transglycosylase domain-containing protein [Anaerolineae bacterium]